MAQEIADSTLLDTWASGGNIVKPNISKIIEGWQLREQPPHEYMNWLQNTFGSKLNHILKNGVANWNNETEYLAGSSVQHNGNVWLCKTTNTNSEPADANENWKRIITVESLTTVLNGYVKNSGDETIAGVKTFSSNPLNTASQSTNANALTKYSAVVKNIGDETISGVKTFSSNPLNTASQSTNANALTKYSAVVKNIGDETISGVKTFSSNPLNTASQSTNANALTKYSAVVKNIGDETISGVKTFSSNPLNTASQSTNANALTKYSAVVKNIGDETISGVKTFSSSPIVPTPTTGDNSTKVATTAFVLANSVQNANFTSSLADNGYQKLPSGLIIQWGRNNSLSTVTLPIAFPNYMLQAVVSQFGDDHNVYENPTSFNYTTTSFYIKFARKVDIRPMTWMAIGY